MVVFLGLSEGLPCGAKKGIRKIEGESTSDWMLEISHIPKYINYSGSDSIARYLLET